MATSSTKRGQFWRADWFVGVLVVLAVLVLHSATDLFGTLERRYYDFASTSTSRQPSDRIAIIAIDDQSIANIGRWPWPRDVHAQLIDQLAAAKAKTIAHTAFFFEPQTDRGLVFIRKIKDALGSVAGVVVAELSADAAILLARGTAQHLPPATEAPHAAQQAGVFAGGAHLAFEKTVATRAPLDSPAGLADRDLKP